MANNMEFIQITWCILVVKYSSGIGALIISIDIEDYLYLLMKTTGYKRETSLTHPIM